MTRWTLAGVALAIGAMACGSDAGKIAGDPAASSRGPGGSGPDTSSTGGGTSASGLIFTPSALVLPVGTYGEIVTSTHDASGVHIVKPTWRSSDPSIAVVGDTGVVFGKALGSAKLYATLGNATDSVSVVVIAAPPPVQAPVSQFNMTLIVMGAIPGADTSHAERIAGATVTLQRVGGVTGDTLKTPVDAGTATTDANGQVKFTNLTGGSYSIRATPPSGSVYVTGTTGIVPPRLSDITINMTLRRQ